MLLDGRQKPYSEICWIIVLPPELNRLSASKPYTKFTDVLRSFLKKHGLKIIPAIIFGLVQAETSGLNFEESS